ncbi:MAG: 2-oxoacid:acceptor oxidoreductase subunit alpha, partial [Cellvibrionaceae bacterium]|nr:2-oxoacid:acceptor oxidoreductase subunit alpha [Cellvibrionaceae bacterium]
AMAQSDACIAPPALWPEQAERLVAVEADSPYNRYSITPAGISPMAIPGEPELMYTADGLEHNAHGTPSSVADDHRAQLDKRADKLAEFDYGQYWAQIDGDADAEVVLLSWGSVSGVCIEACQRLCQQGIRAKAISLRLLAPLQTEALDTAIGAATKLLVVEQSHSAQFLAWLRSKMDLPANTHSIHQPGPLPLRPGQLVTAISEWDLQLEEAHHAANC